jgi:hypothetical protein
VDAETFPGGYSFSNGNELSVEILANNPEMFGRQLSEDVFDAPNMSAFWTPKTEAALNLTSLGVLGNGNGLPGFAGGPSTPTGKLAATEDFMKQFAEPGVQFVDPSQIYEQVFSRAMQTDWEKQIGEQGTVMAPEEVISTTNTALMQAAAFSNPETARWMQSILQNAAQEYIMYLGDGGEPISYPKFLERQGIDQLF